MASHEAGDRPALKLLVVRASDLERSRAFYSQLGLNLRPEKHGDGPLHYSCDLAGTVLELYPANQRPTGGLRLGLRLPSAASVLDRLLAAGFLAERPGLIERKDGPSVCLIRDPDGNVIELEMSSGLQLGDQ
jgi:lactoylglutathione lyase